MYLSVFCAAFNALLCAFGSTPIKTGVKLAELIRRPELSYEALRPIDKTRPAYFEDGVADGMTRQIRTSVEIRVKYKGYIEREKLAADKLRRLDNIRLPKDFDYNSVQSLSTEARQKLIRIQPNTIGEASRIPGVSPNDVSVLLVLMGR